ncbi:MAG: putative adenylate cyclase [SAR86 cluster bacterium SAR86B]|uniref:Putative adenylate cyclase n=1 Tax=SAR86 cluster bacterium SAR86B TaxID=1123867 RepID=J5KIQ8_9GAMM|nr:MAG: putative adenylate cyclase [SAR86 cluster bacterium SAR86B]
MNIFNMLWKSATAYIIAGVALIQLASVVTDNISTVETLGITKETFMQILFVSIPVFLPIFLLITYFIKKNNPDETLSELPKKNISSDYKKKIAVIPFENLNNDDEGDFLVDGIVEDLITEFSMIKEIRIATRKSCFSLKNSDVSVENFCESQELDYFVSGSIRSINDRLRISVELCDVEEGSIIWSSKYDRLKKDIFDIQDEIVTKIINSMIGEIELSSLKRAHRKSTNNMTSYEYTLKGRALNQQYNKESNAESIKMLNAAIEADNTNPLPYSWKACTMGQAMGLGFADQTEDFMNEFFETLTKANELNDSDWNANRILGEVHLSMHEFDKTRIHATKAYNANPNNTAVMSIYADALIRTNDIDKGIEILNKAYETEPVPFVDNNSDRWFKALGFAYFLNSDAGKASEYFNRMEELDERSWLINSYINKNIDHKNENWFINGKNRFENTDWQVAVDRFHLPNEDTRLDLQNYAMSL